MDDRLYRTIIEYRSTLESLGIRVEKILLFGSQARDEADYDSDLDLLVISKDFEGMDTWTRMCLLGRARCEIKRPMEILGLTPEEAKGNLVEAFIKQEILDKGIAVA